MTHKRTNVYQAIATAALLPCVVVHTVLFDKSWKRMRKQIRIVDDLPCHKEVPSMILLCVAVLMWLLQLLPPVAMPLTLESLDELAVLGAGPFGRVSVVRHKVSGDCYALKLIAKTSIPSVQLARQVIRERDIMEAVHHPFVATFLGSFQDESNVYLVSEFIPGGELWNHLFGGPAPIRLELHGIRFYAANILMALRGLHSQGILYRDLKMENMMLDKTGYVKLIDMGFAKQLEKFGGPIGADRRTKTTCGTPEFMAPEILSGKGYGMAVDYWAYGIAMYEIATGGESLFYRDDGNHSKMMARIRAVETEGLPTSATFDGLDSTLKSFITELLSYDPAKRLGCTSTGFKSIQDHAFFRGAMDWRALMSKKIPAPYVPQIEGPSDTRHFYVEPSTNFNEMENEWPAAIDPTIAAVFEEF